MYDSQKKWADVITVRVPERKIQRVINCGNRVYKIDFRGIRKPNRNPNLLSGNREKAFPSPQNLEAKCNEYFASCLGPVFDKHGEIVRNDEGNIVYTQKKPYTISGLALYLGVSTETIRQYGKGIMDDLGFESLDDPDSYRNVIKRAKQRIEEYAEGRLYDRDGFNGAQLVLNTGFHWRTSKEVSDTAAQKAMIKLRKKEFNMKKKLIGDSAEDSTVQVSIINKTKGNE